MTKNFFELNNLIISFRNSQARPVEYGANQQTYPGSPEQRFPVELPDRL